MIRHAAQIIGKQLREFREERGLSLRQAGRELGVTYQTIDNCEKGKRLPQLTLLIAAITKWNVSFSLNGCEVVPKEVLESRQPRPEPVQGAFRLRPRGKYKAKTVSFRQQDGELVIVTVAKISSRA